MSEPSTAFEFDASKARAERLVALTDDYVEEAYWILLSETDSVGWSPTHEKKNSRPDCIAPDCGLVVGTSRVQERRLR